jgi:hypothetical protein
MASIRNDLKEQILQNPNKEFSVLITLMNETLPESLANKGNFVMANKIFSAKISGTEIKQLLNEAEIDAIEPDMEMSVL